MVGSRRHVQPDDEDWGMPDERIEIMRRVALFDELSDRELEAVANASKERRFDTGDTIVGEGEGGVGFFVIADGTARVEVSGARRGTIGPGASFGEVALLDEGGRRTASVVAESPLRVFGITAWQFTPLLEQHPSIAIKIAKILARRLREAEERASAPA
jgi:CRP-like cAMP-binding protein